jgi:hypothetical protein
MDSPTARGDLTRIHDVQPSADPVACNRALVDGDKQFALAAVIAFYGLNGRRLTAAFPGRTVPSSGGVADPEGSRRIADEAGFAKRNISDVLASHRRH